ncbi:hypothetical protein UY3_06013 [Chelonia mydas]|uniref:Uncharacterized protein n=1 Tax=Chelonia mydas TaxID=8469 RepID=M7C8B0_CHEMY|nr:hypothetical protein UY3_06013 [Chelonia mydas]
MSLLLGSHTEQRALLPLKSKGVLPLTSMGTGSSTNFSSKPVEQGYVKKIFDRRKCRRDKSTPECSPVNSGTPPLREVQAESTGERQQSTHHSEDTVVSRSKYVDFSYVIHVAEVA